MNYEIKYFEEKEFLKTVNGMLKFACNNNNGKIELRRISSYFGKSYDVFRLLFEIFEEIGLIKINERTSDYYVVEMINNVDLAAVLHNIKYTALIDMIDECRTIPKKLAGR